ncbi:hypothetical protein F5X97DRAFT_95101 [Nemania serpens]|nr:hypothetical protein F5X97DRAFT_95101 [Nemania serpens]
MSDGRRLNEKLASAGSAPSETGHSMYKCFPCLAFEHAKVCVSSPPFPFEIAKCSSDRRVACGIAMPRNTKRSDPRTIDLAGTAVKLAARITDTPSLLTQSVGTLFGNAIATRRLVWWLRRSAASAFFGLRFPFNLPNLGRSQPFENVTCTVPYAARNYTYMDARMAVLRVRYFLLR